MIRRTALLLGVASIVIAAAPVDPINKDRQGVALKGYDPTAYFQQSKPVKGSPEFAYEWSGALWHFESAQSRDLFKAHPDKYAPQYGGYCSWAVSNNYTADVDPDAWKIVDGKLYLNYSKNVQRKWEPEAARRIVDADRNWPDLHK
jgi:hypothetical protein